MSTNFAADIKEYATEKFKQCNSVSIALSFGDKADEPIAIDLLIRHLGGGKRKRMIPTRETTKGKAERQILRDFIIVMPNTNILYVTTYFMDTMDTMSSCCFPDGFDMCIDMLRLTIEECNAIIQNFIHMNLPNVEHAALYLNAATLGFTGHMDPIMILLKEIHSTVKMLPGRPPIHIEIQYDQLYLVHAGRPIGSLQLYKDDRFASAVRGMMRMYHGPQGGYHIINKICIDKVPTPDRDATCYPERDMTYCSDMFDYDSLDSLCADKKVINGDDAKKRDVAIHVAINKRDIVIKELDIAIKDRDIAIKKRDVDVEKLVEEAAEVRTALNTLLFDMSVDSLRCGETMDVPPPATSIERDESPCFGPIRRSRPRRNCQKNRCFSFIERNIRIPLHVTHFG